MSEKVLHEWANSRFCYRAVSGSVPRVERGGVSNTTRVFAGMTVCNDAATVNELARLASRVAELEGEKEKLRARLIGMACHVEHLMDHGLGPNRGCVKCATAKKEMEEVLS